MHSVDPPSVSPSDARDEAPFTVDVSVADRRLRLSGELDIATTPLLLKAVGRLLQLVPGDLIIDMRGLVFIDSFGLNAIESIRAPLVRNGHTVVVMNASPRIKRTFMLAGLASVL